MGKIKIFQNISKMSFPKLIPDSSVPFTKIIFNKNIFKSFQSQLISFQNLIFGLFLGNHPRVVNFTHHMETPYGCIFQNISKLI